MKFKIGLGAHYNVANERIETKYLVYYSNCFGFGGSKIVYSSLDVDEAIARRDFLNELGIEGVFD